MQWKTPEEAFEAWKACSKGRPCDYSGMSYAKLSAGNSIKWPCNEQYPDATCKLMEKWSNQLVEKIKPFAEKYGEEKNKEPDRLLRDLFKSPRKGSMGLLRDLHDLWLMANEAEVSSIILQQAAFGLRDKELIGVCDEINTYSKHQLSWLLTRMKSMATQTLIIAKQ